MGVWVLASDEATPYSGLEARHLPLLPGLAAGRAGASYLASCLLLPGAAKKASHVDEPWLSWCQPAARPPLHLSIHIHRIWNNTSCAEMDKHLPHTSNIEFKDETGFR